MHVSRRESPIWYSVDPESEPNPPRHPLKFLEEARSGVVSYIKCNGSWWAELAAEEFFNDHEGWECSWPLLLALYDGESGPEIGRYLVSLSHTPVFSSSVCTDKADG